MFSCEFCEVSKNTFFYRTPLAAASNYLKSQPTAKVLGKVLNYVAVFFVYGKNGSNKQK